MKNIPLTLERPHLRYQETYLAGLREFRREGKPWFLEMDHDGIAADFKKFVEEELARENQPTGTAVPETKFWGIFGGEFVGRISVRHFLNEKLRKMGGHIGYDVVPSKRRRGFGFKMLELVLPEARRLRIDRALITCDDDNTASIRIIERCGGHLEKKVELELGKPLKRHYWIDLA